MTASRMSWPKVTSGLDATSILDLGVGTGVTSQRVLTEHLDARLVGVDEGSAMLRAPPSSASRRGLAHGPTRRSRSARTV
jgi:predicted TPR repeat methyltransferase